MVPQKNENLAAYLLKDLEVKLLSGQGFTKGDLELSPATIRRVVRESEAGSPLADRDNFVQLRHLR
jgi:hypothetical protein